jgi:hypothetical protein
VKSEEGLTQRHGGTKGREGDIKFSSLLCAFVPWCGVLLQKATFEKEYHMKNTIKKFGFAVLVAVIVFGMAAGFTACDELNEMTLKGDISITPGTGLITVGTELTANYSGSENVSYKWYKTGTKAALAETQKYTPDNAGVYNVTVTAEDFLPKSSAAVTVLSVAEAVSSIMTTITSYDHGGTDSFIATENGDTVTVTGAVTGATAGLTLRIPLGVKVIWQATLTGSVVQTDGVIYGSVNPGILFNLSGYGTMEMTEGSIANSAGGQSYSMYISGSPTFKISGGTLSSSNASININGSSTIEITGGTIWGISGNSYSSPVIKISGGTISRTSSNAISLSGGGTITVQGDPDITAGSSSGKKIYRSSDATILGYYTPGTKELFDDDKWVDGTNLFQVTQ